jgi:hypothetical protein
MADLATITDLENRLGRTLTGTELTRASALLADASAAFRLYSGQQITQATTTNRLRIRRGTIRLPQRPITDVAGVVDSNANPLLHQWDGVDTITVACNVLDAFAWEPWRTQLTLADVTYTHGYAIVPDDVVAVVCQMTARALGTNPEASGIQQETLGSYSYQVGGAAAAGAVGMLAAERLVADAYRTPSGVIYAS